MSDAALERACADAAELAARLAREGRGELLSLLLDASELACLELSIRAYGEEAGRLIHERAMARSRRDC